MTINAVTVAFDWGTPSGNLDITTTTAKGGDRTPIAAIFGFAHTPTFGIAADHNQVSVGLFDGTNQFCIGRGSPDCCSTWANRRCHDNAVMVEVAPTGGGSPTRIASGVSLITNGVRINVPSDYGDTQKAFVTLFFSDTGSAVVGTFSPASTVDTSVTVTPGISTSALISLGTRTGVANTSTDDADTKDVDMNIGFCVPSQGQVAYGHWCAQSSTQTQTPNGRVADAMGALWGTASSPRGIEYGTFTATQFDATTKINAASGGSETIGYLCLDMPGVDFHADILDTPTTTGEISLTDPGFPAAACLLATTNHESVNATQQSSQRGEMFGFAAADAFEKYTAGGTVDQGSTNPSVADVLFTESIVSIAHREDEKVEVTTYTPTDLGVDLNFSTVDDGAKKWPYLAIDGDAVNEYEESISDTIEVSEDLSLAFQMAIADTISTSDDIGTAWLKKMSDSVGLEDTIGSLLTFVNAVSDQVSVADSVNNILTAIAKAEDIVSVSEVMAARGVFIRSLSDSIETSITINVSGVEYVGLVLNTANMAISTYQGWDFNSFAEIDGHYIGAGREGVYELGGEDDDGTDIEWEIDLGNIDFGNSQDKRLPEIFYACRSDGTILFKVTHVKDGGAKVENWYQATRTSDALTERRVKLKKGVKSQYYRVEIMGKDGSSVDLEKIELTPMVLQRKL